MTSSFIGKKAHSWSRAESAKAKESHQRTITSSTNRIKKLEIQQEIKRMEALVSIKGVESEGEVQHKLGNLKRYNIRFLHGPD